MLVEGWKSLSVCDEEKVGQIGRWGLMYRAWAALSLIAFFLVAFDMVHIYLQKCDTLSLSMKSHSPAASDFWISSELALM